MPSHILHYTNTRSPSLLDTITSDGVAVDLTGTTVKLQMRAVGTSTLKVDAAASIVGSPTLGNVKYDWAALDVDTSGFYTAWWRVTLAGGTTQDTPEFLVEIRPHALVGQTYMSVEELKDSLSLQGQSFADPDLQRALAAASRAIDQQTGRRFYPDSVDQTRKFVPMNPGYVSIDDLSSFTSLTAQGGTWTLDTDFYLEPINAVAEGNAWTGIRTIWKPFLWDAQSVGPSAPGPDARVSVTGKFGWATAPPEIVEATGILSARLLSRAREAAFGVLGIGLDGTAVRIISTDPDVASLIQPYIRT